MNTMKKRAISLLLLLSMLLSTAACSENSENAAEDTTQTGSSEVVSAETTEEIDDGKTHYADAIEAVDYDGWTLNIANDGLSADYFSAFVMEDLTGDAFNDAIYNRNERVMDKFNINIVEINEGTATLLKNDVTSGSNEIGFGYSLFWNCMGLISQDYIKPISEMPVFNLSNPYWDQGSQKTLTFNNILYFGHCDISFDHYEGMATLFYNGDLLTDNGITTTPYELYMENKWTLDAMHDMMSTVAKDTNGDGKMDIKNDIFGFAGRDFEYLPSLYSANTSLVKYDADADAFVLNFTDETVMAVGDKLNRTLNDENLTIIGWNNDTRNLFKEGNVLFYSRLLGDFRQLRDKEDDYGIICYPGLEEGVDGMVYIQNPYTILIPVNCEDDTRLATIIESLAADTFDNVMDVYIEKAIIGKGVRDAQSAELFRILVTKRAYDLCYAFSLDTVIDGFSMALEGGKYASAAKRIEKAFQKTVDKALKALTTYDD